MLIILALTYLVSKLIQNVKFKPSILTLINQYISQFLFMTYINVKHVSYLNNTSLIIVK